MTSQKNLVVRAMATRDATSDGQRDDADAASVVKTPLSDARPLGKEASPRPQSCSRLETLPPELRFKLLSSMPDLQTLRSLVRASPILHAQYRQSRDRILRDCLGREFNGFLIDAYATHMSKPHDLGSPRTNEKITEFTETYGKWLSTPKSSPTLNSMDPERLRSMAAFHLSVAEPLAHRYCKWALGNLREAVLDFKLSATNRYPSAKALDDITLQKCELIRVFRAIYRYETYYNLFGCNEGKREGVLRGEWTNYHYLFRLEPWEAEAVACIHVFIHDEYEKMLNRLKDKLDPPDVRFQLQNGVYRYEDVFRLTAEVNDYAESMISRGLRTAVQLFVTQDDAELVVKMRQCLRRGGDHDGLLEEALGTLSQSNRLFEADIPPDPRDERSRNREQMKAARDTIPPTGPPLGWMHLWSRGYSNVYGEYIPRSLQTMGYVMWNTKRWKFKGAEEMVFEKWRFAPDPAEDIRRDFNWSPW
ncbi:hypothetical protein CEP52_004164 [Fusarium oligoseptatum]|uniref:F-box domain-containing protein n=1 Tax=Fusarium oligoseptatum TaxID=2604345 RepID=A0A428U4Z6_9HYPO|nr:hypothetical protein CEP52_004164 [Fusarium oligoseptatum]